MRIVSCTALLAGLSVSSGLQLAGYVAVNDVTEHAEIDLDVQKIEALLDDSNDFVGAEKVYREGEHSSKGGSTLRDLQGFSTGVAAKVRAFKYDTLPDFKNFSDYYGSDTYADDFTLDAFRGTGDFEGVDLSARAEAAVKGAQYQGVTMYILYELAEAVNKCLQGNAGGQLNWDEGAAFYYGSLVGADGTGAGTLFYTFSNKRCGHYGKCDSAKVAETNHKVLDAFNQGRDALKKADCSSASTQLAVIRKWMKIPLFQGTLFYYTKSETAKDLAEALSFARGILPYMSSVDPESAAVVEDALRLTNSTTMPTDKYGVVYESVYKTLAGNCISCEELGVANVAGAPTCVTNADKLKATCSVALLPSESVSVGLIIGLVVGAVVVLILSGGLVYYCLYVIEDAPAQPDKSGLVQQESSAVQQESSANSDSNIAKV